MGSVFENNRFFLVLTLFFRATSKLSEVSIGIASTIVME
jgi:hypothetical protein